MARNDKRMFSGGTPTIGQVGHVNVPMATDMEDEKLRQRGDPKLTEPHYSAFINLTRLQTGAPRRDRYGNVTINFKRVAALPTVRTHRWAGSSLFGQSPSDRMHQSITVMGKTPMKNTGIRRIPLFARVYVRARRMDDAERTQKAGITPGCDVGVTYGNSGWPAARQAAFDVDPEYFPVGRCIRDAVPGQPIDLLIAPPVPQALLYLRKNVPIATVLQALY